MADLSIVAVFFVGLSGGVHCLGRCGSIVGVFTAQLPKEDARWRGAIGHWWPGSVHMA